MVALAALVFLLLLMFGVVGVKVTLAVLLGLFILGRVFSTS